MIKRIQIKNFAIIDELELDFSPGLTVITGETGSGKSIILQALSVVLGQKPKRIMVKSNAKRAVISANILNNGNELIFQRLISALGRQRNFLDDEPVKEAAFRESAAGKVDFHGQHEQQLIMDSSQHIGYLDRYCRHAEMVNKCGALFNEIDELTHQIHSARNRRQTEQEKQELLQFQLQEISAVEPEPGEDMELAQAFKRGSNQEELLSGINTITAAIDEDERAVHNRLSGLLQEVNRLSKYDRKLNDFKELLNEAAIDLQEAANGLRDYSRQLDFDPQALEEIEDRLKALENLKRKYGGSLESVLEIQDEIKLAIDSFQGLDDLVEKLEKQRADTIESFRIMAHRLHRKRVDAARQLAQSIEQQMSALRMAGAVFEIRIKQVPDEKSAVMFDGKPVKFFPTGYDTVEFYLSANPGEQPKPLSDIASGGEISRIMLAVKTVMQDVDPVDTLVFDEIDSGISGVAAELVADSLHDLAGSKQVICITHLPQIALRAAHHIQVTKHVQGQQTTVKARYVTGTRREAAIRQLTSGDAQLTNAEHTTQTQADFING